MVVGNLIQIQARGPEDGYLYGNPQVTHFKKVYKRSTNFAIDYYKISQNYFQTVEFGHTVRIKIPHVGDLLGGLYLETTLVDLVRQNDFYDIDGVVTRRPRYTSYVNGIGFAMIEEARLFFNGYNVETLTGEMILLINEISNEKARKDSFYKMTQYFSTTFEVGDSNVENVTTYLYLPFFFTKDPSMYLPLCAMNQTEVVLEIKLRPIEQCLTRLYNYNGSTFVGVNGYGVNKGYVPAQYEAYVEELVYGIQSMDLYMKNIYLDQEELVMFRKKELSYLVELYQIGNAERFKPPYDEKAEHFVDLTFYGPTKFAMWVVQREDVYQANIFDNFTYQFRNRYQDGVYAYNYDRHLLQSGVILVDNTELISITNSIFLSSAQLYEHFQNGSDINFYLYSFAIKPLDLDPTGTLNFSKVLKKHLRLRLASSTKFITPLGQYPNILFRSYSCIYNMLCIKDGFAGLLFTV